MLAGACAAIARAAEAGDDVAAGEAVKRATELADGISPGSQQVLGPPFPPVFLSFSWEEIRDLFLKFRFLAIMRVIPSNKIPF